MAKNVLGTIVASGNADGAATITFDAAVGGGTAAGTLAVAPGGEVFFIPTSSGDKTALRDKSDLAGRSAEAGET
jgi:hypothetical protein